MSTNVQKNGPITSANAIEPETTTSDKVKENLQWFRTHVKTSNLTEATYL